MSSRIFPDWEQIYNFKPPLTDGELELAKFLDKNLPATWEIYLQPYLNGDKPDLAILNPSVGVVIFEVKDWDLGSYHTKEEYFFDKTTNQKRKRTRYFVTDSRGTYPGQTHLNFISNRVDNLFHESVI